MTDLDTLRPHEGPTITVHDGYAGFATEITFTPAGSLKSVEAYE
jgi:hypothetical protein